MNTQCWRPNEAHRILLGGKGKEELVKMATLLCISAQGALFFFPIPAILSIQMSEPRLIQITRTLPIAMERNHPIPKTGSGRGVGKERWPECTITVSIHIHWTLKTHWEDYLQYLTGASLVAQTVKRLPAMRETGVRSWLGRSPEEGNGNLLQYSCLGNSMDRGAW